MTIATINPATGETERTFDAYSRKQIDVRLDLADRATRVLAGTSFEGRRAWMHAAADILEAELETVAALATIEMGKTIGSARFEVSKTAKGMRYYADRAAEFLADEFPVAPRDVGASIARVTYQPLGTILAVMPWNFPFWQVVRFAAPALMAGNTVLLKHASSVPQCALYLGGLFERAGFPTGAFQTLLVEGADIVPLLDDARIRAVTLTGSVEAGSAIAAAAGRNVKKSVLELGGSDPFVVLPSADVDRAAELAVTARVQNSGQSCIAGKRFIVHDDVYDNFEAAFVERMASIRTGDPFDPDTTYGPLATEAVRRTVKALVDDARSSGARILLGGEMPAGPGWFYPPTVIAGVTAGMRLDREECFGPVASLYRVLTVDAAIELANDSPYGLSAMVWTTDATETDRLIAELEVGAVFVNGLTSSFPGLPFGGVKRSGYGRELSAAGIREFTNVKTVWQA
jgi:succinate-semialdehyde dehydrogenase/glutarate-semialdehyde dehydrogenase